MGELATFLRGGMETAGYNYSELARRAGISAVYAMKIVKGERIPSDAVIGKLARVLGLDPRRGLFLAHRDKTPEEFRGLFKLPEPLFPRLRETLLDLCDIGKESVGHVFEIDRLGQVERAVMGLFSRIVSDRAILDEEFRIRCSLGSELLERLEWGGAYFEKLEEALEDLEAEAAFCTALRGVILSWDLVPEEDVIRVALADGRRREYKFCLLERGRYRRELVLDSVRSRSAGKDQAVVGRTQAGKRPQAEPVETGMSMTSFEKHLLMMARDRVMRDLFAKAMSLPPDELEEARDIIELKLRKGRGVTAGSHPPVSDEKTP